MVYSNTKSYGRMTVYLNYSSVKIVDCLADSKNLGRWFDHIVSLLS